MSAVSSETVSTGGPCSAVSPCCETGRSALTSASEQDALDELDGARHVADRVGPVGPPHGHPAAVADLMQQRQYSGPVDLPAADSGLLAIAVLSSDSVADLKLADPVRIAA